MNKFFEDKNQDIVDWTVIKEYRQQDTIAGYCMALLESHKLLDSILSEQGYQGEDIYQKIRQARGRFTDLKSLNQALAVWEKVFKKYDEKIAVKDVEEAISSYEKAIYDLSSETDYAPPGLIEKVNAWFDYYFISQPQERRRLLNYFLAFIVLVLVLDNTHFGQKFVEWLAGLLNGIVIWIVGIAVGLIALLMIISGLINFMEQRK